MEESKSISLSKEPNIYFDFRTSKKRGLSILKKGFVAAFFASLALSFFGIFDGTLAPGLDISMNANKLNFHSPSGEVFSTLQLKFITYVSTHPNSLFMVFLILLLLVLAIKFFIINPIEAGGRKFFTTLNRTDEGRFSDFAFTFSNNYIESVKKLIVRDLFLFLWAIASWFTSIVLSFIFAPLFFRLAMATGSVVIAFVFWLIISVFSVLPIGIAFYRYKWIPYIVAENTDITPSRAMDISKQMMYGYKWKLFLFDLSFIGWYALGVLTLGLGILFVNPYMDCSKAVIYETMRAKAVKKGIAEHWELGYESDPFDIEAGDIC